MNIKAFFLKQTYDDSWSDYHKSLFEYNSSFWDFIILTVSNDLQKKCFETQINDRKRKKLLPSNSIFIIISDSEGKRVGSGGATLSVLRELYKLNGTFKDKKILVIHSGGDSKRVPQYSALGKLFSPVPHVLPDGRLSTLFDEILISMSSMASRIQEGMLLLSGDALLLFNPLQVDFNNKGAACISIKEDANTGKNHGVFLNGKNGYVKKCLQKQSVETLKEAGAVNEQGNVDIDTGAILFGPDVLESLYKLVDTDEKYDKYVNDRVRLSLYVDFLYPMALDSTLESFYNEKPEGTMCNELLEARKQVWDLLSPYKMKLIRLAPAKFIHFGTTREVLSLMNKEVKEYEVLGWRSNVGCSFNHVPGYNSVVSKNATVGSNCYIETSYVHSRAKVGNNCVLSYIYIHDETIPDNVVVHGLKLLNGKFVARIFGVNDNPKETKLFGIDIKETLWTCNLYEQKDTINEAVKSSLNLYKYIVDGNDVTSLDKTNRISLADGFNNCDPSALIEWDKRMYDLVKMEEINKLIINKSEVTNVKSILTASSLSPIQELWLERKLKVSDFSTKIRLYYYIGYALGGSNGDKFIKKAFKEISTTILESSLENVKYNPSLMIKKDKVVVTMPLRINFGGGWSDTPIYCNENGGAVLNASLLLNGKMPVEVTIEKIKENKIIFESRDMDVYGEFTNLSELQDTGNPYDSFALQKAALLSVGIIPQEGGDLNAIFDRLGGGFKIDSEVIDVPKGSGLGTSSILSAAVVKALFEFFGKEYEEKDLYQTVLVMEQIMSTGGGWQDQVGGVTSGFKFITSKPGIYQTINVNHLSISQKVLDELNERFCLIYTGERRLARNILRDVIERYIGNIQENVVALKEAKELAIEMKNALVKGDFERFVDLSRWHFSISLQIDSGSSNILIDKIFTSIENYCSAKIICGAGGGGFIAVILKKGIAKEGIHVKLRETFQELPVDIWETKFC